ncbi:MAG TPA: 2-aminoethylphosphonate--pyruvate transaminase [Bryobacteraceae bacterium]|jgi:2-aminoethylphosphonate-pyruvate transaminase|nr:2-aminoethylphosphonate--pyruvate transaminase [Bryobacteraceae bacterium]
MNKLLFTPGPLTTSLSVKEAMLRDIGSRDAEFLEIVREIREQLLALGNVARPDYECVLMQGSGTFMIESVISSVMPGKLLVLINGAYGRRIENIARVHGIAVEVVEIEENRKITPADFSVPEGVTHVAVVHCETTTGILNPIEEIGEVVARAGAGFIVDAMSSFGAIPIDANGVDFLISSANKCIEGVPGFGFTLVRRTALDAAKGRARTLSLDLYSQWAGLERDGQFRFTPPTHALLAFRQALRELDEEGGVAGRGARYRRNHEILSRGMKELGFEAYLAPEDQSPIITSFRYPKAEWFRFEEFYARLSELGYVIYPGKLSREQCFRIGTIGRLTARDVEDLLHAIGTIIVA